VGAGVGRLRRAAASTAHGRHAAGLLCHGRDAARRVSGRASAEAGQARRWAGLARRAALAREARCCRPGRLRPWAGNEAAAREMKEAFFNLYFQEIFKCQLSNIILSKKMTSFENVPKIKID